MLWFCWAALAQHRHSIDYLSNIPQSRQRVGKRLGGDAATQLTKRTTQYCTDIMPKSRSPGGGHIEEERKTFITKAFVFWSNCYTPWDSASQNDWTLLVTGSQEHFCPSESMHGHLFFSFLNTMCIRLLLCEEFKFSSYLFSSLVPVMLRKGDESMCGAYQH